MKRNSHYLIILLILSGLLMTVLSFVGSKSIYAHYNYNYKKDGPILTLALRGFSDEISPLALLGAPFDETTEKQTANTDAVDSSLKYFTAPASAASPQMPEEQTETSATGATTAPAETSSDESSAVSAAKTATPADAPIDIPTPEQGTNPGAQPDETPPPAPDDSPAAQPDETPAQEPESVPAAPPAAPTPATGTPADDSYYADALFIGDSRTVGLSQYVPGLDSYATFYCQTSLNIFNALSAPMVPMGDGMQTAEVALSRRQFGKIYIMLGINEIGYGTDAFISAYADVINRIRALQPAAVIYIQGIMHVSASKQAENPVFNNASVNERNGRLAALTNGTDIIYMDINYLLDDAGGALNSAYTFDGVHLTADSYALWYQEIREQTR